MIGTAPLAINREKMLTIMGRLKFFKDFNSAEKVRILEFFSSFLSCPESTQVVRQGTRDRSFFIILKGEFCVFTKDSEHPVAKLRSGEMFGEIAFLTGQPRTADVRACCDSILLRLDQKMLDSLPTWTREKIKDQLIDKLANNLTQMNELVATLSGQILTEN